LACHLATSVTAHIIGHHEQNALALHQLLVFRLTATSITLLTFPGIPLCVCL
jgi:hypothetical protein